jgi:hypothetical protein
VEYLEQLGDYLLHQKDSIPWHYLEAEGKNKVKNVSQKGAKKRRERNEKRTNFHA